MLKVKAAVNTPYNSKAVIAIDKLDRIIVIEKDKYNSDNGTYKGTMQVVSTNKKAFYIVGGYTYSPEAKRELFNFTDKQEKEMIQLVKDFYNRI